MSVDAPAPAPTVESLAEALDAAREEALRYRRAYELVSAAFSQNAGELYGEKRRQSALDHARLVRIYGPADVVCYDYWLNAGATVIQEPFGAAVATPPGAWHYAAGVPLDFSGIDFAGEECWVRVRLGGIAGQVGAALYDAALDAIAGQAMADEAPGIQDLIVPAQDASAALLLLRNGALDRVSRAIFLGAEILAAPKPPAPDAGPGGDDAKTTPPQTWRELNTLRSAAGLRSSLRAARDRTALALIDRWAPVLARRGPALDRRVLEPLARLGRWWRAHVSTPRTLWGVTPILTLPLLARADRLLGLRSQSVVYTSYFITSRFDINFKRLMTWLQQRRPQWVPALQTAVLHASRLRFDAYHYFSDRGLGPHEGYGLDEAELKLIRDSGHRLYAYAYGGDVRTRLETLALGPHNLCRTCPAPGTLCICDDELGERNQQTIARHASAVVSMGDMIAYAQAPRIMPYWPMDVARVGYVGVDWSPQRPLRVAHAPNHPYFKGTSHLLDAIARLQSEGRAIELVRVQGVANTEVLRLFAEADLVADQFVAGAHGYTALEAMLLGKPVLCYLRNPSMVIDPDICPMINTWPESVYRTLRDCLDGRYDLTDLGRRSRNYVEHHHSIEAVALRLGQMYLDTAGFPERTNRRIRRRMAGISARLQPLQPGPPPIPWVDVPSAHPRPALAA